MLVHRAGAGEREAWAAIYDRYADQLHDYCWSILRDHHEAEDALHDAFVVAASRLGQLRDPARLRPWLYAICRSQALGRARRRSRAVPTAAVTDVTPPSFDEPSAERSELAELVQDAAAGLPARDRAVLDLHLRHGFDGAELGEALGVDAHHATVLLSRVRSNVERSLAALLVGRTGRGDCPELDRLLSGWDGSLSPLVRKRVARHIDNCEVCAERRRRMVSPVALLGLAPPVLAPSSLRERVLDSVMASSAGGPGAGRGSSSDRGAGRPSHPRRRRLVGAGAAVVLVALGTAVLASGGGGGDGTRTVAVGAEDGTTTGPGTALGAVTSVPAAGHFGPGLDIGAVDGEPVRPGAAPGANTTSAPSVAPAPSTILPATTVPTTTTTTAPPAPGAPTIVLDSPSLDFATSATELPLRFSNDGLQGLAWTVTSAHPALSVAPSSGLAGAGDQVAVTVTLDRARAAEGELAASLEVGGRGTASGAAAAPRAVPVAAVVERPPAVTEVAASRPRIVFGSSVCSTATATAGVADDSPVTVVLTWRQATGAANEVTMRIDRFGRHAGTIGPVPTPGGGDVTWFVTATDARGNRTRSADQVLPVANAC